jgi:hypothetical protein
MSVKDAEVVLVPDGHPAVASRAWQTLAWKFPAAFYFAPAGLFACTRNPTLAVIARDINDIRSGAY